MRIVWVVKIMWALLERKGAGQGDSEGFFSKIFLEI